jgi:hypothetical protein
MGKKRKKDCKDPNAETLCADMLNTVLIAKAKE